MRGKIAVCVALVALCVVGAYAMAGSDESSKHGEHEHEHEHGLRCGTRGGHCEARQGCSGRAVDGLCDDSASDSIVCCIPKKGPKKLSASEKAARAAAKKRAELKRQHKKSAAVTGEMTEQQKKEKAKNKEARKEAAADAKKKVDGTKPLQIKDDKSKSKKEDGGAPAPADSMKAEAIEASKKINKLIEAVKSSKPKPPAKGHAKKGTGKGKGKGKKHKCKKGKGKKGGKGGKNCEKAKQRKHRRSVRRGSRGIDVAQRTSKKSWKCLKNAGWDWAVVRGWGSSNEADHNAARSLRLARKNGFSKKQLGVYVYPCAKCGHPKRQINRMIKHLTKRGAANAFSTIWLDIEGSYWPTAKAPKKPKSKAAIAAAKALAARKAAERDAFYSSVGEKAPQPPAQGHKHKKHHKKHKKSSRFGASRKFFRELIAACRNLKKYKCGIYTSEAQWKSIMGKRPIKAAKGALLWYPQADAHVPDARTKDFKPFSGFTKAYAKQYSQNQSVCGLSVDVNVVA